MIRPYKKNESPDILLGEGMVCTHSVLLCTHHINRFCSCSNVHKLRCPLVKARVDQLSQQNWYFIICDSSSFPSPPWMTFTHIPASYIIFPFAALSPTFSCISLASDCAHPFQLVTLCLMASTVMVANLRERAALVAKCVGAWQRSEEQG